MMKSEFPLMANPAIGVEQATIAPVNEAAEYEITEGPNSLLSKAVRRIAGVDLSKATNSEDLNKPSSLRMAVAKEVYGLAHNQSTVASYINKASNAAYIMGMLLGKPMNNIVAVARKAEYGLSTLRRLATGAALNSPLRMTASFLGFPNLLTKNDKVGELLYLENAPQVSAGDSAETVLSAAKEHDKLHGTNLLVNGAYKNLLTEPIFFARRILDTGKELVKDPSLIKDHKWISSSALGPIINFSLAFLVKLGLKTNHLGLARLARAGITGATDAAKFMSPEQLRQFSGSMFAGENAVDVLNGVFFKGKSARASSLVAMFGQIGRLMGSIYHNPEYHHLPRHEILQKPSEFIAASAKAFFKFANPFAQQSQSINHDKFHEALGLTAKVASEPVEATTPVIDHARKLAEAVGNIAKAKVAREPAEDMVFEDYGVGVNRQVGVHQVQMRRGEDIDFKNSAQKEMEAENFAEGELGLMNSAQKEMEAENFAEGELGLMNPAQEEMGAAKSPPEAKETKFGT